MNIGRLGMFFFCDAMTAPRSADFARRIESLGYGTLWVPEAVGREAMAGASWLLASTTTLNVATGIANVYARDAMTMAAAANTLAEQSGGRFVLGIGVSHKPMVEDLRGHSYDRPLSFMRAYLERMEASMYVAVPPGEKPPVVIGALHPRMLRLAGEKTRGAHPYLMSPTHTAFAREQVGKDAWLCPEQKVMLESDADRARSVARQALALYFGLPNYRRALKRYDGFTDADFENGGSDRLVDACVAWGDEQRIRERIAAHHDAGADHVCIQPLHPEGRPEPDWRILEALAPARA